MPIEPLLRPVLEEFGRRRQNNACGLYFLSERGAQVSDHISRSIRRLTGGDDVSVRECSSG